MPGHGAASRSTSRASLGLLVLLVVVRRPSRSRLSFTGNVDRSRVPRRVPARRPRDAVRDRGRGTPRVRRRATLGWRPLRWIGLRSYGLYLWHYPIFCVTRPGVDFDHFGPSARLAACSCCGSAHVRRRRAVVPLHRTPIRTARSPLPRSPSRHRRASAAAACTRGLALIGGVDVSRSFCSADSRTREPQEAEFPGPSDGGNAARPPSTSCRPRAATTTAGVDQRPRQHDPGRTAVPDESDPDHHRAAAAPPAHARDRRLRDARRRARPCTRDPGIAVDAKVSRQFGEAVTVLGYYRSNTCYRRRSSSISAPTDASRPRSSTRRCKRSGPVIRSTSSRREFRVRGRPRTSNDPTGCATLEGRAHARLARLLDVPHRLVRARRVPPARRRSAPVRQLHPGRDPEQAHQAHLQVRGVRRAFSGVATTRCPAAPGIRDTPRPRAAAA